MRWCLRGAATLPCTHPDGAHMLWLVAGVCLAQAVYKSAPAQRPQAQVIESDFDTPTFATAGAGGSEQTGVLYDIPTEGQPSPAH